MHHRHHHPPPPPNLPKHRLAHPPSPPTHPPPYPVERVLKDEAVLRRHAQPFRRRQVNVARWLARLDLVVWCGVVCGIQIR